MSISSPFIDVCNYEQCYPSLWNRHVVFSELGDADYPYPVSDYSPACFTMIGEFRKPDFLLIGERRLPESVIERAAIFALECAVSGKQVMVAGIGEFSRSVCKAMNEFRKAPVVLLRNGFNELFDSLYWMLPSYCLFDGGFISAFKPELKYGSLDLAVMDELIASFSALVFFSMSPYEYSIAQSCLDKGGLVYLHYAALSEPLARSLARDGAPVIEHIDSSRGYVYKRRDGVISFLNFS